MTAPLVLGDKSVEGNFPCCPSCKNVSHLAEAVAGHSFLEHIVSIHLKDVIAAVRDERSVGQRHALIAKGDDCVSLRGGNHQQCS